MLLKELLNIISPGNSLIELREQIGQYDTHYIGEVSLAFLKADRFSDFHNIEVERISQASDDRDTKWLITLK